MTKKSSTCKSCCVPLADHLGIAGTCKKLNEARAALKSIYIWATYGKKRGHELDADAVAKLCDEILNP